MRGSPLVLALVAASVLVVVGMSYYYSSHNTPPCADPDSISGHVYNPSRLDIIRSCIIASGFVDNIFKEADGDYHIRLALDSQYSNLAPVRRPSSRDNLRTAYNPVRCDVSLPELYKQHHNTQHRRSYHSHRTLCLGHGPLQLGRNPPGLHPHNILDFCRALSQALV